MWNSVLVIKYELPKPSLVYVAQRSFSQGDLEPQWLGTLEHFCGVNTDESSGDQRLCGKGPVWEKPSEGNVEAILNQGVPEGHGETSWEQSRGLGLTGRHISTYSSISPFLILRSLRNSYFCVRFLLRIKITGIPSRSLKHSSKQRMGFWEGSTW